MISQVGIEAQRHRGTKKSEDKKISGFVLAVVFVYGFLFLSAEIIRAEPEKVHPKHSGGEIKILITSDQVEFDPKNEIATYTGKVTVTQENTSLYADRIEVHFVEKGKSINLIKAYGHIRIVQEDRILTAEEGVYYHQERKVILTGNPTTRQGENCIRGDTITYFWDQGKAVVEGNVKATIAVEKEKIETLRPK